MNGADITIVGCISNIVPGGYRMGQLEPVCIRILDAMEGVDPVQQEASEFTRLGLHNGIFQCIQKLPCHRVAPFLVHPVPLLLAAGIQLAQG